MSTVIHTDWPRLKAFIQAKSVPLQYLDYNGNYYLSAADSFFTLEAMLSQEVTDPPNADLADFENNFKSAANKKIDQTDTDGAFIFRQKAAKAGFTYCALPFEVMTSKLNSLYSKDVAGVDRAWITAKFYDANNVEVIDPANEATIVKTQVDFEPPYDYELIGGSMRYLTGIVDDIRLWIIAVPDIPANLGGSKEMCGGINLMFLAPQNNLAIDGRVSKAMTYNAQYHTNKLRFIWKHSAGVQERIAISVEVYKQ